MPKSPWLRWLVLGVACLVPSAAPYPALAQAWRGSTAFDVEVTRGKQPAAGVEVLLVFLDLEAKAGPAPVLTNTRGVATVEGLAQGRWRLELRADGKSPYSAVIQLTAGEKTLVVAGPVRDAAAAALTVKLGKARLSSSPAATTPPPAPSPKPQAPVVPPAPKPPEPKPPETKPAETKPAEAKPAEPTQETPRPTLVPKPTPPPEPPKAEPPKTEPAPAPRPMAPPPVAPPPLAPAPAPEAPAPSPQPPPPTLPAPPALRGQAGLVAQCPECKPGEQALAVTQVAGPATSPATAGTATAGTAADCGAEAAIQEAITRLATGEAAAALGSFLGSLVDPASGQLPPTLPASVTNDVLTRLAPYLDPNGPCQLLAVVLPAGHRYSGYAYEASESGAAGVCVGAEPCEIAQATWLGHPTTKKLGSATLIYGVFRNLSPSRERRAKLVVYFRK